MQKRDISGYRTRLRLQKVKWQMKRALALKPAKAAKALVYFGVLPSLLAYFALWPLLRNILLPLVYYVVMRPAYRASMTTMDYTVVWLVSSTYNALCYLVSVLMDAGAGLAGAASALAVRGGEAVMAMDGLNLGVRTMHAKSYTNQVHGVGSVVASAMVHLWASMWSIFDLLWASMLRPLLKAFVHTTHIGLETSKLFALFGDDGNEVIPDNSADAGSNAMPMPMSMALSTDVIHDTDVAQAQELELVPRFMTMIYKLQMTSMTLTMPYYLLLAW